ncbi:hypothetical protein I4U23_019226 [Adineta vaga]|nr:hypothetical protein I4U23_019226 [Adineta vaga]
MATFSFIFLTYCVLILTICQLNLSFVYGLSHYRMNWYPSSEQDSQSISFHEYLRKHHPINYQKRSLSNAVLLLDSKQMPTIKPQSNSRLDWFKRNSRPANQSTKRMLCFFHAVNCFG